MPTLSHVLRDALDARARAEREHLAELARRAELEATAAELAAQAAAPATLAGQQTSPQ